MNKIIYQSKKVPVGNGSVQQSIPNQDITDGNPFILLHHVEKKHIEPGKGFYLPPHPHRGFQPVTFVFDGEVNHRDSLGNNSIVKGIGAQWINSASGLLHSEGMPESFREKGGDFEMIQLWINLPSSEKMKKPTYHGYESSELKKINIQESGLYIVSGNINNNKGPHETTGDVTTVMGELKKGNEFELSYGGNTKLIYLLSGKIIINNENLNPLELIKLNDTEKINIKVIENSRVLILGGDKINEPIKAYGPYVMNTQSEIIKALNDYENGDMGKLNV